MKPMLYPLAAGLTGVLIVTTSALAGSGVGSALNLGQTNAVDAQTVWKGNAGTNAQVRIESSGSGSALALLTPAGVPPLKVVSSGKVQSLNADLLDGVDSTRLWNLGGNAGTTPAADFIGTTDDVPLHFRVNGSVALRLVPGDLSANVIGGAGTNSVNSSVSGATIFGGIADGVNGNKVISDFGSVLGGAGNTASFGAAVLGGVGNNATGVFSIAGGEDAQAPTIHAVALGQDVHATGGSSFALGQHVSALHDRSFVWNGSFHGVSSFGPDTFTAASSGGARFISGFAANGLPDAGVELKSGNGSWSSLSDRASKHNFTRVSAHTVLRRLDRIPITRWSYKSQRRTIRHVGPMAQDFRAAFGLGEDNRHIDTIDSEGVALAAIQGLYRQNKTLQRQNRTLRTQLGAQNARLTKLEHAFSADSH
jgi:hypothetical protein